MSWLQQVISADEDWTGMKELGDQTKRYEIWLDKVKGKKTLDIFDSFKRKSEEEFKKNLESLNLKKNGFKTDIMLLEEKLYEDCSKTDYNKISDEDGALDLLVNRMKEYWLLLALKKYNDVGRFLMFLRHEFCTLINGDILNDAFLEERIPMEINGEKFDYMKHTTEEKRKKVSEYASYIDENNIVLTDSIMEREKEDILRTDEKRKKEHAKIIRSRSNSREKEDTVRTERRREKEHVKVIRSRSNSREKEETVITEERMKKEDIRSRSNSRERTDGRSRKERDFVKKSYDLSFAKNNIKFDEITEKIEDVFDELKKLIIKDNNDDCYEEKDVDKIVTHIPDIKEMRRYSSEGCNKQKEYVRRYSLPETKKEKKERVYNNNVCADDEEDFLQKDTNNELEICSYDYINEKDDKFIMSIGKADIIFSMKNDTDDEDIRFQENKLTIHRIMATLFIKAIMLKEQEDVFDYILKTFSTMNVYIKEANIDVVSVYTDLITIGDYLKGNIELFECNKKYINYVVIEEDSITEIINIISHNMKHIFGLIKEQKGVNIDDLLDIFVACHNFLCKYRQK